ASYVATVISTALLYCVAPGWIWLGFALIVVSNTAYAIGESFIASFLPFLGKPHELGRVSGFGWALGYAGGLVATVFALIFLGEVSADNFERVRWVGPFAAAFFLFAAIPTFLGLREPEIGIRQPLTASILATGYRRLCDTMRTAAQYPDLRRVFISILFAM